MLALSGAAQAQAPAPPASTPPAAQGSAPDDSAAASTGDDALFTIDSPLGPIEYRPARGLRVGNTGLTIGGFSTLEIEREDGEPGEVALDGLNLLVLYEPIDELRFFGEVEFGDLFVWQTNESDVEISPDVIVERLYAEYSASDALNLRLGKFQTPVGRWNLAPAEPFVWTATQPLIVEEGLDEHQTGVALFGSFHPEKRAINYWLYGQVVDELDTESDEDPAERSVGARLEYGEARGAWSFGGSLQGFEKDGAWSTLGGLDAQLRVGEHLELSSELLIAGGEIPDRDLWGAFVEGAYHLDALSPRLSGLYLVGRYEHFDPSGGRDAEIFDVGLTWLPVEWLNFKVGYRFSDRGTDEVRRGLNVTLSVLF